MRTLEQFKSAVSRTLKQEFSLGQNAFHQLDVPTRRLIYSTVIYRYKGIGKPVSNVSWEEALQWKSIDDVALSLYNAQEIKPCDS